MQYIAYLLHTDITDWTDQANTRRPDLFTDDHYITLKLAFKWYALSFTYLLAYLFTDRASPLSSWLSRDALWLLFVVVLADSMFVVISMLPAKQNVRPSIYYAVVLIGRTTSLARPSVCLSVRRCEAPNSNTKRCSKTKIDVNLLQGRSNRFADFQLQRSKVKEMAA